MIVTPYLNRRCRPDLRDLIKSNYPVVFGNSGHMRFLSYILFSTWMDSDDPSRLVMSQEVLYQCYPNLRGNKSGIAAIAGFEAAAGFSLDYVRPEKRSGRSGTVTSVLPVDLEAARDIHYATDRSARTVYFLTGRKATKRGDRTRSKEIRIAAHLELEDALKRYVPTPERRKLIDFLNSQAKGWSAQLLTEALKEIEPIVMAEPPSRTQTHAANIIAEGRRAAELTYRPVAGSDRVYACGINILQLPRQHRILAMSTLTDHGDVYVLDLRCAQLAIVSKLWGCPATLNYIKSHGSVWAALAGDIGIPHPDYKDLLKVAVYATTYGMGKRKLRALFLDGTVKHTVKYNGLGDPRKWRKFITHPVITELLSARDQQIDKVTGLGHAIGPDGGAIAIHDNQGWLDPLAILSSQAQAYEQYIMAAVLRRMMGIKKLYCLAYLHDGVTILSSDRSRTAEHVDSLRSAASEAAEQLGICTYLEAEQLLPPETAAALTLAA